MLNTEGYKKVCDFRDFNLCTHKQIGEIIKVKALTEEELPSTACGTFNGYTLSQGSYTFVIAGMNFTPEKLQNYQWWDMKLKAWKPFVYNPEEEEKELSKRIPKDKKEVSNAMIASMKAMSNSGYTTADIAEKLGVSTSTVIKYIK